MPICSKSKRLYTTQGGQFFTAKSIKKIQVNSPIIPHFSSTFVTLCQFAIPLVDILLIFVLKMKRIRMVLWIWLLQFSRCLQSLAVLLFVSHFFLSGFVHHWRNCLLRQFQTGSIESATLCAKSNENGYSYSFSKFNTLRLKKCVTSWSRSFSVSEFSFKFAI